MIDVKECRHEDPRVSAFYNESCAKHTCQLSSSECDDKSTFNVYDEFSNHNVQSEQQEEIIDENWFKSDGKYKIGQINGPFKNEEDVDKFIEVWSCGNRGTVSKAAHGEVLAQQLNLESYGDLSVIFLDKNTFRFIAAPH